MTYAGALVDSQNLFSSQRYKREEVKSGKQRKEKKRKKMGSAALFYSAESQSKIHILFYF
jgi:hypothetical protein